MPTLSVVVLNWNRRDLTEPCVDSIRDTTDVDYELIVVDNGSDDPTPAWIESIADTPVLNPANLGFAAGMNSGLAVATGEFVAFVNNDTVFPAQWASRLIDTFGANPDAGIVLPAVTAAGNPFSVRNEPGDKTVTAVPFRELPSGVVYLARTKDMRQLGGWDERYRLASREDIDLLFMMWANCRTVVLDERVLVEHVSSATVKGQLEDQKQLWRENWDRFVDKWTEGADISLLDDVDETERTIRLREAQTAAFWMKRWMEERQRFYAKNREWKTAIRQIETLGDEPSMKRAWWRRP